VGIDHLKDFPASDKEDLNSQLSPLNENEEPPNDSENDHFVLAMKQDRDYDPHCINYLVGQVCPTRPRTGPSDKWSEDLARQVVSPTCRWPMSDKWLSLPARWVIEQAGSTTCRTAQIVPWSSGAVRRVVGPASRTPRADHMLDVPVRPIPTCRADMFNRSSGRTRCPTCPLVGQACPTSAGPTSVTCRTCRFDESNSSDLSVQRVLTRQTGLSNELVLVKLACLTSLC
jgi:hypothetical protein